MLVNCCLTVQWSFGITYWEIFSLGLESYPSVDVLQMTNYLKGGGTLDQPPLCSNEMYVIHNDSHSLVIYKHS